MYIFDVLDNYWEIEEYCDKKKSHKERIASNSFL